MCRCPRARPVCMGAPGSGPWGQPCRRPSCAVASFSGGVVCPAACPVCALVGGGPCGWAWLFEAALLARLGSCARSVCVVLAGRVVGPRGVCLVCVCVVGGGRARGPVHSWDRRGVRGRSAGGGLGRSRSGRGSCGAAKGQGHARGWWRHRPSQAKPPAPEAAKHLPLPPVTGPSGLCRRARALPLLPAPRSRLVWARRCGMGLTGPGRLPAARASSAGVPAARRARGGVCRYGCVRWVRAL